MNTNMKGFGWFSKMLRPHALDKGNLSIGKVNIHSDLLKFKDVTFQMKMG